MCDLTQRGTPPQLHVNFMKVTQTAHANERSDRDKSHKTVTHLTSNIFRSSDENFIAAFLFHSLFPSFFTFSRFPLPT